MAIFSWEGLGLFFPKIQNKKKSDKFLFLYNTQVNVKKVPIKRVKFDFDSTCLMLKWDSTMHFSLVKTLSWPTNENFFLISSTFILVTSLPDRVEFCEDCIDKLLSWGKNSWWGKLDLYSTSFSLEKSDHIILLLRPVACLSVRGSGLTGVWEKFRLGPFSYNQTLVRRLDPFEVWD